MPYVIGLLVVIVFLLFPPLWPIAMVLFIIFLVLVLIATAGPLIALILAGMVMFMGWDFFFLEDSITESIRLNGDIALVSQVMKDIGYAASDRDQCAFATCYAYRVINGMLEDGELVSIGPDDESEVRFETQVLRLTGK